MLDYLDALLFLTEAARSQSNMEQVRDNAEVAADPSSASMNQSPRSIQAQRLMQKLEDSDEVRRPFDRHLVENPPADPDVYQQSLALLLTQAADSIESLLNQSDGITAGSQDAALDLVPFEDLSQDWLANIYVSAMVAAPSSQPSRKR